MKKTHKILVTAALCVGLMLIPVKGQREARAQGFPTIDVSNLVQNVLKYLSDIEANGISVLGQSIDMAKYQEAITKFTTYLEYIEVAKSGSNMARMVVDISKNIVYELDLLKDMSLYFVTSGCPYSFYEAAQKCYDDFFKYSNELVKEAGNLQKFYMTVGKGESVIVLMQRMEESMYRLTGRYNEIVRSCNSRIYSVYRQDMYRRQQLANQQFLGFSIY